MQKNLNDTLLSIGSSPNIFRDNSVYDINHRFWGKRPLTSKVFEWASGDVQSLFELNPFCY